MTVRMEWLDELAKIIDKLKERKREIEFELSILQTEYNNAISQKLKEKYGDN